jgi:hypothetical protein
VGDVMHLWNPNIYEYEDDHILRLIIFYNDDFGIKGDQELYARIVKVERWLREL